MNLSRLIAPIGSVALLTLLAASPLGIPADDRFFLPLLPVVAIHYWTLRHDAWLPEWVVFLAGLALDILTHGPVGYWAFIYLLAHLIATLGSRMHPETTFARLLLLGLAIAMVTIAAWAVASVYFFEVLDWGPYVTGGVLASLCAILVILPLLRILDGVAEPGRNIRLTRGA